jgi:hypothetical protein
MKKAKVLLTAITVLAVVGGAFAFKAQRNNNITVGLCSTQSGNGVCNSRQSVITDATFTDESGDPISKAPVNQACNSDADCTTFTTFLN